MYAEYTKEEILEEENGNLDLYYHGCLSRRPKACPLEWTEEKETNTTENNSAWDFHWDGGGNYEQERAGFYGEFS